jgi:D-psicose/D-tagatose/L-ribulose 3-epimerase
MYETSNLLYHQIVEKAGLLGYQGIELNFKDWPSDLEVGPIKASLQKTGVEVAAIGTRHMNVTHGLYLSSPVLSVRKKAFDYMTECMNIANELNCNILQAGWAFQGSKLEVPYNATWNQAVISLKHIGQLCRQRGIIFVIEFACRQNAQLVNTMNDALRMLDEVGEENVLVMADTFHIQAENDSLRETVLKADDRLAYVHLSDSNRLSPGKGIINFKEFIDALKEIHYDGHMVMEYEPGMDTDGSLKNALYYIKNLL